MSTARGKWTHTKRKIGQTKDAALAGLIARVEQMLSMLERAYSPANPKRCFDMSDGQDELDAMIDWLYAGDFSECIDELLDCNPDLLEVLECQTTNSTHHAVPIKMGLYGDSSRKLVMASLVSKVLRVRNQFKIPPLTAIITSEFHRVHVNEFVWELMCSTRDVGSRQWWTTTVLPRARLRHPGCPHETVVGVTAACLDNCTFQVAYQGLETLEEDGYRMDMTNWLTLYLHADMSPRMGLNFKQILTQGDGSIQLFKPGFDKYTIADLFDADGDAITTHRARRFERLMRAAAVGRLFTKSNRPPSYGKTHMRIHRPMFGKLQSSEVDVEEEVEIMRAHPDHAKSAAVFACGDGLWNMRLNTLVQEDHPHYLASAPAVIPMVGEHPHGTFHFLHAGERNYRQVFANLRTIAGHKACKGDPKVEEYNNWKHALCICMRGVVGWLVQASTDGHDVGAYAHFEGAVSENIDTLLLFEFLNHFCFPWLDFKQAVNEHASADHLDMCWREFLPMMRTLDGHKTQYGVMAVVHIYWGQALVGELAHLRQEMRCVALSNNASSMVGVDMPVEKVNRMAKQTINPPVTEEHVATTMEDLNFEIAVHDGLSALVRSHRSARKLGYIKAVDTEVARIVAWLNNAVGETWDEITTPKQHSALLQTRWGDDRKTPAQTASAIARGQVERHESQREYVCRTLERKITWM